MRFIEILLLFVAICAVAGQLDDDENCEIKREAIGTVSGVRKVNRQAERPWLISFFNNVDDEFICRGALITEKHVVAGE